MKKIILLMISILMVTSVFAKAGNPIPSFNVPIANKAYFQEDSSKPCSYAPSDEKRDMNVSNDTPGNRPVGSGDVIKVYIFRLDQAVVLGPFFVFRGATLTVPIDGHRWGVYAETMNETFMSVWTNDQL